MSDLDPTKNFISKNIIEFLTLTDMAANYDDIVKAFKNKYPSISEMAISKSLDYLVNELYVKPDVVFGKKVYKVFNPISPIVCKICEYSTNHVNKELGVCSMCLTRIMKWPEVSAPTYASILEQFTKVTPLKVNTVLKIKRKVSRAEIA